MKNYIRLLRPQQWIKNFFVFAPLIFSAKFLMANYWLQPIFVFIFFSIASSTVYIFNDLKDADRDRLHPTKSKRPIASGLVTKKAAVGLLLIACLIMGIFWLKMPRIGNVIILYILINAMYTLSLKKVPVVDIFVIAIGFVLRVYAGAIAVLVPVSDWMFITTLSLALYLASIKRLQELQLHGIEARDVLRNYSVKLVERYAEMSATAALTFYSMFVITSRPNMAVTIPIVLFGIFRYWYLVDQGKEGESPTDSLLQDWQLISAVAIWVITSIILIA